LKGVEYCAARPQHKTPGVVLHCYPEKGSQIAGRDNTAFSEACLALPEDSRLTKSGKKKLRINILDSPPAGRVSRVAMRRVNCRQIGHVSDVFNGMYVGQTVYPDPQQQNDPIPLHQSEER